MSWRTLLWGFLLGLLVLCGSLLVYRYQKSERALPRGFVWASGRLEGDTITVATKVSGRIEALYFQEGDFVSKGKLLARLSSAELEARYQAAQAAIQEAQKHLEETRHLLATAQATLEKRARDRKRFARLFTQRLVSKNRLEEVTLAYKTAYQQVLALKARISALNEEIERLRAQKKEIEALLADTRIRAPARGVILRKVANLGEVLSPGGVIALMVDLDQLYLKAYVPTKEVGRLALGQRARIYVDAFPHRFFTGKVGYIAREAEFTPKEVQTREARVKLVYEVKIYLDRNPGHVLTPGLPADALIQVDPKASWPARMP
ncbi:MAG: secretion protein HlyD [Thermodesulfatator sp.]|nr:MAG: secretion protein HlyD [Thermodesulfatator sp.]